MALTIGASTGVLFPLPVEEAVVQLAENGFEQIEAVLHTPHEYSSAFCRDLQRRAGEHGARVVALHAFTRLHPVLDSYQRRREYGVEHLQELCDSAADAQIPTVVWHGPSRDEAAKTGATLNELLAIHTHVARGAGRYGVILTLENVSWCMLRTVEEVRQARAAGARFTFDPFQALESRVDPLALLSAMDGALAHVHASDFRGSARHLIPGDGDIDWPAFFSALEARGYAGPVINEAPVDGDLAALRRGHATLERALNSLASPRVAAGYGYGH